MKLRFCASMIAALAFSATTASAQTPDCNKIKNNPASKERCIQALKEAAKYERQSKFYNGLANLREKICIVDNYGDEAAAIAAGWRGKIVYRGTRAAADAISNGASSCKK